MDHNSLKPIFASMLSISMILLSMGVNGNISIDVRHSIISGQGPAQSTYLSYLKEVNITIHLYEEQAYCKGFYEIHNPSDGDETLDLFFDPSYYARNCTIRSNGIDILTAEEELDDEYYQSGDDDETTFLPFQDQNPYPVRTFSIDIPSNSSVILEIDWTTASKVVYYEESSIGPPLIPLPGDDEYYKKKITDWGNSYLVISESSWREPICDFKITYYSHCKFFDYPNIFLTNRDGDRIWSFGYNSTDIESLNITYRVRLDNEMNRITCLQISNWSREDTIISYEGWDEVEDVTPNYILNSIIIISSIFIIILILVIGAVYFYYGRLRKKRNPDS